MNGVLVLMEQTGSSWHRMSWETLAAGQQLGADLNLPVWAAVAGNGLDALGAELATRKLDRVYLVEHGLLESYTPDGFTAAFEQLIRKLEPTVVLLPHTYQVRDFAPKLATRFGRLLISDAISYRNDGDGLTFVRQLFQGKLNSDVKSVGGGITFASLQAGAYRAEALQAGSSEAEVFAPELNAGQIREAPEAPFRESARAVDLTTAEIIVSVGRGIKEQENISIVQELADAMHGELAASRPICDNGWLPMERQVGSSGQTVSPKLYLAVGISGAIQHQVGMKGAKTVVAINKDPNAPIFEIADYGIVGDLFEVVPALTEAVNKARG